MPQRPAVFQIDAIESYFHGVTQDQHWNGFACPLFSFEEAQRLMELNNHTDFCGQIVYDAAQDAFLFHEFGVESEERPDVFKAVLIDGEKFYPIGAFSWCWQDVSNDSNAQFSAELVRELSEMKRLGMNVPDKAFSMATNEEAVAEHAAMSVSDAADLIVQLAAL